MAERSHYHVFNAAKMRILAAAFTAYPHPITTGEISQKTGMKQNAIARLLSHYDTHHYGYFQKLKKRSDNNFIRYKLNKKGIKTYISFVRRIKLGIDLNMRKKTPVKMETYTGVHAIQIKTDKDLALTPEQLAPYVRPSYIGEHKLGLKKQDVLMLTGIIKDTEKTTIDARKSKPETGDIRESEEQEDLLLITKGSAVKKPIKEPLTSVNNSVSVKKPIMIPAVASKESVAVHETVESPELHMAKTIENEIDSLVKKLNTATSEAEKRVIDNDLDQRFAWLDSHKNVFSEISPVTINNLKKWQKKTTNRIKRLEEKLRTANNLAEITLLKAELEKYSSWRYYHQEQLCKGN